VISLSSALSGLMLSAQEWARTATCATIILVACGWFGLSLLPASLRRGRA
jgi:zinc transport system permease protein